MIGWPFDDVERRGVAQKKHTETKDRKRKDEKKKRNQENKDVQ